ncbi:hypothetical protein [Halopenitus persicus]|nr:hypothetical protein [Halopenitus persicus]
MAISAIIFALLGMLYIMSFEIALQGLYLPSALLLSAIIILSEFIPILPHLELSNLSSPKLAVVFGLLGIPVLIIFDFNFYLTMGYIGLLLVLFIIHMDNVFISLSMICFIIFYACIRKFGGNYFYHGPGDLLVHIYIIKEFLSQSAVSVNHTYQSFPGYHLIIAIISDVAGVKPYVGLIIVSVVVALSLVLISFKASELLTGSKRLSLAAAALFSTSWISLLFSTYFIPQSLAVFLFLTLLLCFMLNYQENTQRYTTISILIICSMSVIHHLTFVLVMSISLAYLIGEFLFDFNNHNFKFQNIGILPLLLILIPLSHWIFNSNIIQLLGVNFLALSSTTLDMFFGSSGGEVAGTIYLGNRSNTGGIPGLVTIYKIHYTLFLSLVFAGLLISLSKNYSKGIISAVIIGIPIVFPTPIGLSPRFGYPWIYLMAMIAAIPLEMNERFSKRSIVVLIIVGLTVISGAAASADDINILDPSPQEKVTISQNEYQQLHRTSVYLDKYNRKSILSPRITGKLFGTYFSTDNVYNNLTATERGFRNNGQRIIYRESWTNHSISPILGKGRDPSYVMTTEWLTNEVTRMNQIYSSGSVGVVY